jgi:hypothetical protein
MPSSKVRMLRHELQTKKPRHLRSYERLAPCKKPTAIAMRHYERPGMAFGTRMAYANRAYQLGPASLDLAKTLLDFAIKC